MKKPIDKKKKGSRKELEIKKVYESLGYECEVPVKTRWNWFKDFFHVWDLMAIRRGEITFIQVKSSATNDKYPVTKAIDKAKDFIKKHGHKNNYMMIMVLPKERGKPKYSNYRIWEYKPKTKEWKEFDDLDKKIYFNQVMIEYL
jgi:Holliday junction resolvase